MKATPKRGGGKASPSQASTSRDSRVSDNAAADWLFGSDAEDEQIPPRKAADNKTCVITRRVPGGTVRRTAQIDGDLLVELRLYNYNEVRNLSGLARCEKAVVWLRLRGDGDSADFNLLKKFLNKAKEKFTGEGTFFADKNKKP